MAAIEGGPIRPVRIVSESELRENGGTWTVKRGPALRVTGCTLLSRPVEGGNNLPIYIVTQAQVDQKIFNVAGNTPLPIATTCDLCLDDRPNIGQNAQPVYVTNDWPQPFLLLETGARFLLETGGRMIL